jgi:plasmid stability protein
MTTLTIRKLPEETRRALKLRAAQHGRSTEAEVRAILQAAVQPRSGLGAALLAIGRDLGGVDLEVQRHQDEPEPARFE